MLEFIIFISGAVVMIFELAGSRVVAPYLGTSIVVWTSLIGIILGSLSFGYFIGGRLADKYLKIKILSLIMLLGAFCIGITAVIKDIVLIFIQNHTASIHTGSIMATLILFAPGSVFLGMVSPYVIRLKLESIEKSGRIVGRMYAISTVGSIAGTFSAGFFLIPFFGSNSILFVTALLLVGLAFLTAFKSLTRLKIFILVILVIGFLINGIFIPKITADIDTKYSRYWIYETSRGGRQVRVLSTDPHGTQSAIYIDSPDELVFSYTKFFALLDNALPEMKKALLIGGGAFIFPRTFIKRNPGAAIDVVEIDKELINISRLYFDYIDDPRIKIYHEDGRMFLNKNRKKYDRIYLDAFSSNASIPFQLTTREAVDKIYNSLDTNGVVLVNMVSGITGDKGKFLRAELATYKSIFPEVFVYQVGMSGSGDKKQNLVLMAGKNKNNGKPPHANSLWPEEIEMDLPILTDDYAPVDYYTKELVKI